MRVCDYFSNRKLPHFTIIILNATFIPIVFNQIAISSATLAVYRHLKIYCCEAPAGAAPVVFPPPGTTPAILAPPSIGASAGVVSGVVSGVVNGVVSGVVSGIVSGVVSGIVSGVVSGIVSGIVSGVVSGTVSGVVRGVVSGVVSGVVLMRRTSPGHPKEISRPLNMNDLHISDSGSYKKNVLPSLSSIHVLQCPLEQQQQQHPLLLSSRHLALSLK
jgi:hypothetical protein